MYLTNYSHFLVAIIRGEKEFITTKEMSKAWCPNIEGLYMKNLLKFIEERPELTNFLPNDEEIVKSGRDWVANVLQTKCCENFSSYVR